MILNTIKSDAKSCSDIVTTLSVCNGKVDVAMAQSCARGIHTPSRGNCSNARQADTLCFIQGHSPWRSYSNRHKISLLFPLQTQRKNSSFSLSRKIQNEKGSPYRIRHEIGEVIQRIFVTANNVTAGPNTG